LEEKGLALHLALPRELPPITADRRALQDIVESLLSNAALASPSGGAVEVRAEVGEEVLTTAEGHDVTTPCLDIAIEDSGQGINPDDYDRVFAGAQPGNGMVAGLGNTGVGMSMVKTLVEAHGGAIWLKSSEAGTTFFVRLPLDPAAMRVES
jgi:signal transduction histidine kinase